MINNLVTCLILFVSLLLSTQVRAGSALSELQLCEQQHGVAINLIFDKEVDYHCLLLSDPLRFVIDLKQVTLKTALSVNPNRLIKKLRNSDHGHEYLRLVFDLNEEVNYTAALSEENKRLTIKLKPSSSKQIDHEDNDKLPIVKPETTILANPVAEAPHKSKQVVVVIDPGHGGKDPGAIGQHAAEKDVVLKIGKKLQTLLNEEPGFKAILTRSTDIYLPLRKRLAIARKHHADLFIAIHADAYSHSQATGAAVYALSQRGATSEAARWLAEKENESELGGLSNELADKDAILRSVLIDLSQTHTIESSLQIGTKLLRHLEKIACLHHPRVEQAAFVVLKSPDIPSVLVETGFLSNQTEEDKLVDPNYQRQTAIAIKEGIKRYFLDNKIMSWPVSNSEQAQVKLKKSHPAVKLATTTKSTK